MCNSDFMKSTTKKLANKVTKNPVKSALYFSLAVLLLAVSAWLVVKNQEAQVDKLPFLAKRIYVDVENLKQAKYFPSQVNSLNTIKIAIHTKDEQLKRAILQNIHLPLKAKKDGNFALQVDVIENFDPPEEAQIILQFNLYETLSRNKIWEFSRLYQLSLQEFDDLKKLAVTLPPSLKESPPAPNAPGGPQQTANKPKKSGSSHEGVEGLKINRLEAGSIWEKLGLMNGDIVTSFNGRPIKTNKDLADLKAELSKSSGTVKLEIQRKGKMLEKTYTLK